MFFCFLSWSFWFSFVLFIVGRKSRAIGRWQYYGADIFTFRRTNSHSYDPNTNTNIMAPIVIMWPKYTYKYYCFDIFTLEQTHTVREHLPKKGECFLLPLLPTLPPFWCVRSIWREYSQVRMSVQWKRRKQFLHQITVITCGSGHLGASPWTVSKICSGPDKTRCY